MEADSKSSSLKSKVTYKFERYVTYEEGESYTDVKMMTIDPDAEEFNSIHSYMYGWLRSAFGHIEAPTEHIEEDTLSANLTWDEL